MIDHSSPIGIFDSGMGGLSVLYEVQKLLPNENYIYYGDTKFAPYGTKSTQKIIERSRFIVEYFIDKNVKAIIIACNTATSAAVKILRSEYDVPIIGMEPALKPAIEDPKSKIIGVLATPVTLKENKFNQLMKKYGAKKTIYKIPCPNLVEIVEQNKFDLAEKTIKMYLNPYIKKNVDTFVLGCTHFIFLKKYIEKIYFNYTIYDGNLGTAHHLKNRLIALNLLAKKDQVGSIIIENSAGNDAINHSKELIKSL